MKYPKFKVGVVVAYSEDAGRLILEHAPRFKERVKLGCRGIITAYHADKQELGEFYTVSWFGGNGETVNEVLELERCKGLRTKRLCNQCEDRNECYIRRA